MRRRAHFSSYTPPARDSGRARAQAVLFLVGARSIERVTVEGLAHRCRLTPETARSLLNIEKKRRAE